MLDDKPLRVAPNRRVFLRSASMACASMALAQQRPQMLAEESPGDTYETHAVGIRILPGSWRPHYPWEHIAWVSPPWASQDYLWLDFPEAIFTSQGLIFLSHVNPPIHTVYQELPAVAWKQVPGGIAFDRTLPSGISFGGSVNRGAGPTVDLELHIKNGSNEDLANITLQTCAFLRAIEEFADFTHDNKFVHVPETGWIGMSKAAARETGRQPYRVGWRNRGNPVADLPVAVALSNDAERLVAMTWFDDTLSLVGNPRHPCFHADPKFPDLAPGEKASIHGKLIFFEGPLAEFDFAKYVSE